METDERTGLTSKPQPEWKDEAPCCSAHLCRHFVRRSYEYCDHGPGKTVERGDYCTPAVREMYRVLTLIAGLPDGTPLASAVVRARGALAEDH